MGRRPNPLILEFFERGAKLQDNSNRYHHRCRACGEDFPKGRIEGLTTHLTKKCPAISEADRVHALLSLHGISTGANRLRFDGLLHSGPNQGPNQISNLQSYSNIDPNLVSHPNATPSLPAPSFEQSQAQIWTPLETLAEVSRQIEANEKHDDHVPTTQEPITTADTYPTTLAGAPLATTSNAFEFHEPFTLENPPMNVGNGPQREGKDIPQRSSDASQYDLHRTEERLRELLEVDYEATPQSTMSVAAAAAARMNTSLLDQQLLPGEMTTEPASQTASQAQLIEYPSPPEKSPTPPANNNNTNNTTTNVSATPWDGMTYMPEGIQAPVSVNENGHIVAPLRGGFRMDTSNGVRQRHSRARFDSGRRKEVQEIRRIGACIRCRILRKTCSKGTPCETCQKVLTPRVWQTGCVRTKLEEYMDLYSAGVQVVMAQKRINSYKTTYNLVNTGLVVQASHFPETGHKATFQVLQGTPIEGEGEGSAPGDNAPVVLLDNNSEDIPGKVESYMRQTLDELICREPSHYVRVTLDTAVMVAKNTDDMLLKRSLELWGIVELMDRERQWTMLANSPKEEVQDFLVKDDSEIEAFTNICMQLTAAAERKASAASKVLLNGIQRHLQDGKTKLGFPMFLTVMLFLNCMEKTTWAFKAWDEENLRPKWPLEKPPSNYTNRGQELTELLRMLLGIRHILPRTVATGPDSPIVTDETDPTIYDYFQRLAVTPTYLHMRREQNNFQPTDSRSLEFMFCASLLLN
ncbi:hypothetical protein F5Y04DRAFT_259149 [Hypomontagnella monticulosa]|nr:hypothetical protein F5Y04DRAFT_259149 [Hypomontagnella monticulosa]